MRLFLISLGTLSIALVIGLIVRLWGLSLPYKKFEHPFFDKVQIQNQPLLIPVLNSNKFDLLTHKNEGKFTFQAKNLGTGRNVIWASLYITSDRVLISDFGVNVDSIINKIREDGKFKGKYIHNYTRQELSVYTQTVPAGDVVTSFPDYLFIFNVLSNEFDIHKDIIKFIEENKLSDRVLINSPVDVVIKSIKDQRPMWAYGTSLPEVARLKSFSTLGLEPAISVRGDVFIAPISYMNRPLIDESLVTEIKRRKKFVFIGPLDNEEQKKLADEFNPDGVIF